MRSIIQMIVTAEVKPDARVPETVPENIALPGVRGQRIRMIDSESGGMAVNENMGFPVLLELLVQPGLIHFERCDELIYPNKKCIPMDKTISESLFSRGAIGRKPRIGE